MIDQLIAWMESLPGALVYVVIGVMAGLENIVPPVPADVIALTGGFMAGRGVTDPILTFVVVWGCNVATALLTYWVGRRYGTRFFQGRLGRMILQPGQMSRLGALYEKHGGKVIFFSRYLPGFRAVVPIFAGTSGMSLPRTALPIALASGLWYGLIVYLGATAGRNWEQIRAQVEASGRWLALAAVILFAVVAVWWWKTRGKEEMTEQIDDLAD
ncbi:DedA family protein [Longimicrobium sp.]|uniref:DedA family protein n=1 Tax=Longimicrobium sp. TaxID=2029185 RepID=UPI002E339023|nr:DedA family protein [Longimicrobium sp.]HEX6040593.1 DedA family protein [Longimicrobium sp.]